MGSEGGRPSAGLLRGHAAGRWLGIDRGPAFGFSETWQLVINTGTTIVTFLMVFLIQSAQNRDSTAVQLKLDELIRAVEGAQNSLLDLEELDEGDLERMRSEFEALAEAARRNLLQSRGPAAEE